MGGHVGGHVGGYVWGGYGYVAAVAMSSHRRVSGALVYTCSLHADSGALVYTCSLHADSGALVYTCSLHADSSHAACMRATSQGVPPSNLPTSHPALGSCAHAAHPS